MKTLTIATRQRDQLVEITDQIRELVHQSAVQNGIVVIFVPHTTVWYTE